jgi:hypothetical protein
MAAARGMGTPPELPIEANVFHDPHGLVAQLRQSVFGRVAEYEDVNDADMARRRFVPAG